MVLKQNILSVAFETVPEQKRKFEICTYINNVW